MDANVYHVMHVGGALLLTGFTFRAFAAPPESRKSTMALAGIFSLATLVGGFGLVAKLGLDYSGWVLAKMGCWLALAILGGLGYRMEAVRGLLSLLAMAVVLAAVYFVYFRPF
jgi:hypothetical protein